MNPSRKLRWALCGALFAWSLPSALHTFRQWVTYPGAGMLRVDYSLYVASALQGLHQGWHHLHDLDAQRRAFEEIPGLWWFPNVYTPALSMLMIPFTRLSLGAGYTLWSCLLLGCMLLSWAVLAPGDRIARAAQLPMLFATYPVQLGLWMGQVIPIQIAALAICWFLLRRGHEKAAGAVLVVIALKPQGLLLVPIALLVSGRKKFFFPWAACMGVVGLGVLALIGFDGAFAYLERLTYAQAHLREFWVAWSYSLARRIENPPLLRLTELAAVALALFAAWRHRDRPEIAIAAGLTGSLVASPFIHLDDFMLLFPALWLLLRAAPGPATVGVALLGYAAMALCQYEIVAGRWVLLFACLLLPALALPLEPWPSALPRRTVERPSNP